MQGFARARASIASLRPGRVIEAFYLLLILALHGTIRAEDFFNTNEVLNVDISITKGDWDVLRYQHREAEFFPQSDGPPPDAYTWFPATVTLNGREVAKAQVRKKGYIGSNDARRPGLKIRFADPGPVTTKPGTIEMTLNNNNQDPSLVRQYLSYEVFRRAGVPSPRCSFATVSVNGRRLGIYTHVESIKEPFLKQHFGRADGNLYEGGRSDFRLGWFANFEMKNNESRNRREDLEALTRTIESTKESLLAPLERHIDVDEFLRFWAIESLINHSDGYAGNVNNFYLYHDPSKDRFSFIPWGADTVLYRGGAPASVIGVGILAHRLYHSPDGRERYRSTMRTLLDTAWNEDGLLKETDRLEALLKPHVGTNDTGFSRSLGQVRDFIKGRRAEIQPELDGPAPELQSKLLEYAKRRNVGHVEVSFSTTWSKAEPFREGTNSTGTVQYSARLYDRELKAPKSTVRAGALGGARRNSRPGIVVRCEPTSEAEPGFMIVLSIDPELYGPDKTIAIDNTRIEGFFVEIRKGGAGRRNSGMLKGSLELKKAGLEPGAVVEGKLIVDVYSKYGKL